LDGGLKMNDTKRSLILKYFSKDLYVELMKITMLAGVDNNARGQYIKQVLRDFNIPFTSLGSGTNRMAVLIDGYAVKIALDKDGMTDSKREILYTKALQPYVVKVYECVPSGLISVCEFVEIFTLQDFRENQDDMRSILADISKNFLIGDCGVTSKNYVNWGRRNNGEICILDFAYIYSVNYTLFRCTCSLESILQYDKNYVDLICPVCNQKFTFGEMRRRITKAQQEKEIGDIKGLGYNLTSPEEKVELREEFENVKKEKKCKKANSAKLLLKNAKQQNKEKKEKDYWNS
jgi:hypothetical protein